MTQSKRATYVLLAIAPFVLLTARGRRLAPRLPTAVGLAGIAGVVAGVLAVFLFAVLEPPGWGLLMLFVLLLLPLAMAFAEAATAAGVIGKGFALALLGAVFGHVVWTLALVGLVADSLARSLSGPLIDEDVLALVLVIVPGALFGAAAAGLGAALARRRA